jgi:hypothetical protein
MAVDWRLLHCVQFSLRPLPDLSSSRETDQKLLILQRAVVTILTTRTVGMHVAIVRVSL